MSETRDISEASTIPAIPTVPAETPNLPLDFGPLIDDNDADDFDLTPPPPAYARPRRKLWLTLGIIALLVILLGGGIFALARAHATPAVQYTQAAATVGNLTVTVSGTGPVQAGAIYNLNFATSAPIQTIDVQVGQQVTAGQKLATLDPTSLQDAVNQAQNNVNSAQTAVNNAENNLGNTESQENNSLAIAKINEQNQLASCKATGTSGSGSGSGSGGGSGTAPTATPNPTTVANCETLVEDQYNQTVDQANSAINNASNQVTSAQQQLTNAQTSLQTAQDNLKNATLVAPHAGVIEAINGMVGENAGSGSGGSGGSGSGGSGSGGSGSSSAFIVRVDASTLNVAAQINEANIAEVAVNQPAQFTVAAYPSQTFRATVTSIDTLGQTSSNVVTYLVNLAVNMQSVGSDHVYPGMTATVNITTAERISTLLVPSSALSFASTALQNGELSRSSLSSLAGGSRLTGTGASGSRGIVVELKNGQLVPVLVTTGLTNGQETEILSGLQEGDQVVISQTGGTTSTTTSGSSGGRGLFGGGGGGGGGRFIGGGGN
jgi:multidrug efflux pump subunit AcrA (membrane-fusion protein)